MVGPVVWWECWLILGIFLLFQLIQSIFNRNIIFAVPKEFVDPQVSDDLKVNSIRNMNFNDPMEFDDP